MRFDFIQEAHLATNFLEIKVPLANIINKLVYHIHDKHISIIHSLDQHINDFIFKNQSKEVFYDINIL